MNRTWTIIIVKFMIAAALILLYVFVMSVYIAPFITQQVFGQQYDPYQGQQPYIGQYEQQQQYGGGQQYDPYSSSQQYQQPYQQYGTQTYQQPYQQYGMPPQQNYLGFGVQEIVTALIAGGGATAYARRRTNSLENDKQLMMAEMLKDKQRLAELARVSYNKMPQKGYEINDAPIIKLDNLNQNVDEFTQEVAKS